MAEDQPTITQPLERIAQIDNLREFWGLTVDVWQHGVFGIDLGKILIAIGIFVIFMAIRRLFTWAVLNRLENYARRSDTAVDDRAVAALRPPVRFVPIVMGVFFAFSYLDLDGKVAQFSNNIVRSLIIFTLFWAFFRLVTPLSFLLGRVERIFTSAMVEWLVKAIKVLVAFLGAATILEVWGIEIGPILAGLGLFGVAVALGAQDLFKNLIAGILILMEKRFSIGEWVKVDGIVEGIVESIGFRSTFIRRFDQAPVYVPNAHLSDSAITNFSRMTYRRIFWLIGLEYRTDSQTLARIRDRLEKYILDGQEFVGPDDAPTFVRLDSFNASSIDLMLYCFTKTTIWGEWLEIKEKLAFEIKHIVEEEGASFAFPSTSLYVEKLPEDRPETYTPPEEGGDPSQGGKTAARGGKTPDPSVHQSKARRGSTSEEAAEDEGEGE
ncbi:mechanosensitive ion channel family protein [Marivibrio halodurans]|uniref:Mechanosensitive ion channel family protein n=1 Tax=Marivibrio halodurans TaxID=2039722 RepID=A0A8J7RY95_9PROT|nr:mechanosensitive ion channel family protein [Marivibrio halodurans]MBP5856600.1 mechanosensitive ion channel family protein [Marivibrio halodurans]